MRNWFGKVRKQPGRNLDGRLLREKNKMKRKDRVLHKRRKRVLVEKKGGEKCNGGTCWPLELLLEGRASRGASGRDSGPTLPGPEEEETV